jgi:hypothetical protein
MNLGTKNPGNKHAKKSGTSRSALRNKIIAVLLSLVALWAFAAFATVRDGVGLVWFATLEQQVEKPTQAVISAIQSERTATVTFIDSGSSAGPTTMDTARTATDAKVTALRNALDGTAAKRATSSASDAKLRALLAAADTLPQTRKLVDGQQVGDVAAAGYYSDIVRAGLTALDTFTVWSDSQVIYETSTLVELTRAQETLSQEDALMSGAIAAGKLSDSDRTEFSQLVGVQRYLTTQISDRLPGSEHAEFSQFLAGTSMTNLRALEDEIDASHPGVPPVSGDQWQAAMNAAVTDVDHLVTTLNDQTVGQVKPTAIWVIVRLILAAGLGLVAVIASIRFLIRTVRRLQSQLSDLRVAAYELAEVRLPIVVEELRRGEAVDVSVASPPLAFGDDDIGQVSKAFNHVSERAIRATVEQAELRRGVRDLFLNLARRSQALVHRQLKLIDAMERRATTDEELGELFAIDHLATRMRRNAENLIVLSGAAAGRAWRGPIPMVDVMRGAQGEVEEYTRIKMRSVDAAMLSGRAVGDVIHLLAELMENALSFSPPNTVVFVSGQMVAHGYAIEIEDRGLGMTEADFASANAKIENPPEFQMSSTSLLGFYVVGRLGQRHQIRVHLRRSPYDGVTAIVVIPLTLINEAAPVDDVPAAPAPAPVPAPGTGRAPVASVAAGVTPSGLPVRVRRPAAAPAAVASPVVVPPVPLLPPIAAGIPSQSSIPSRTGLGSPETVEIYPNGRAPEDVRSMLASYQRAATAGRARAEEALGNEGDPT